MISAIRSNPVLLAVLFLALAAQIPHAQTVFYEAGHNHAATGWWMALLFAIALESAVLMFVAHGWHNFSYVFALSSILVNMAYYGMLGDTAIKVLVSLILPLAIACYSHLLANDDSQHASSVFMFGAWADRLRERFSSISTRPNKQPVLDVSADNNQTPDDDTEQPVSPQIGQLDGQTFDKLSGDLAIANDTRSTMAEQRRQAVLDILATHGAMGVSDIAKHLPDDMTASRSTISDDLKQLEKGGKVYNENRRWHPVIAMEMPIIQSVIMNTNGVSE